MTARAVWLQFGVGRVSRQQSLGPCNVIPSASLYATRKRVDARKRKANTATTRRKPGMSKFPSFLGATQGTSETSAGEWRGCELATCQWPAITELGQGSCSRRCRNGHPCCRTTGGTAQNPGLVTPEKPRNPAPGSWRSSAAAHEHDRKTDERVKIGRLNHTKNNKKSTLTIAHQ